ncbi:hypothetical protein Dimus_004133 [Dionaea muscipula]
MLVRECVEKLELLNKPEERQRRIHEIPEVHVDPPMDATYESDEETGQRGTKMQDAKKSMKLSYYNSKGPSLSGMVVSDNKKLEKNWHYQDPSGKIQGPFCILQLRKWNTNGYFPINLRIWRVDENHDQSILLIDALTQSQSVMGLGAKSDPSWRDQRPNEECCSNFNQTPPNQ